MSDDLLSRAARALRQESEEASSSAQLTRARVLASVRESTIKRRTRAVFLMPFAACFLAATAWGSVDPRLPELARSVVRALGFTSSSEAPPQTRIPAPVARVHAPHEAQESPIAELPRPAVPEPERSSDLLVTPAEPSVPPVRSARPAPAPADPLHGLYRNAHQAHFAEQDFVRALAGWNAYLQAAPGGRFALEAEYNRALCLLRLGREAEARSALAPFADGARRGYRQAESRALLDAMHE